MTANTLQKNHVVLKFIVAATALLGVPVLGVGGYYELRERSAANLERIQIIENRQLVDRQEWHTDMDMLRSLVDTLMQQTSTSASKIDLLLQMQRYHANGEKK